MIVPHDFWLCFEFVDVVDGVHVQRQWPLGEDLLWASFYGDCFAISISLTARTLEAAQRYSPEALVFYVEAVHQGRPRDEPLRFFCVDHGEVFLREHRAVSRLDERVDGVQVVFDAGQSVCFCGGGF